MSASSDSRGERTPRTTVRRTTVTTELDRDRGVFMISVAAELAEMHPQTLRMYEAKGLINPKRSPKNTRLYSQEDVERLRRIQAMTADQGLNLAGVETVLELESKLEHMRRELRLMQERTQQMEQRMSDEIERAKRSLRAEIVPYRAYESTSIGAAPEPDGESSDQTGPPSPVRIPVQRKRKRASS